MSDHERSGGVDPMPGFSGIAIDNGLLVDSQLPVLNQDVFNPELVDYGAELGDWFYQNQQLFMMMDDNF
jgi:hypothetical protein